MKKAVLYIDAPIVGLYRHIQIYLLMFKAVYVTQDRFL